LKTTTKSRPKSISVLQTCPSPTLLETWGRFIDDRYYCYHLLINMVFLGKATWILWFAFPESLLVVPVSSLNWNTSNTIVSNVEVSWVLSTKTLSVKSKLETVPTVSQRALSTSTASRFATLLVFVCHCLMLTCMHICRLSTVTTKKSPSKNVPVP
jgi:hypothetical protein